MSDRHAPTSEAEVAALVAEAAAAGTPLAIAGGGTRGGLGRPVQAAATLSTRALAGVTLYEPAELVVAARAGTPLAEVEALLDANGQRLTFEPMDLRPLGGGAGEPTIGAVAAANVSGPRRIQAGAARDSLIGVAAVNGRGEAIRSGGRVMKNVTGYDLVKLLAGSYGTLGVITEVTFKVLPKTESEITLVLEGLDDAQGVAALAAALGSPFEVSAAAHLPALPGQPARTLMRLEGFERQIAYRSGELAETVRGFGPAHWLDAAASAALWREIRDAVPLAEPRERAVWRISTAPTRGPAVVAALAGVAERHLYDWGGGLVWIATSPEDDCGAAAVRAAVRAQGGHATLVRAPEAARATLEVFEPQPEPLMRITRGLKSTFDPAGILNPGRMYAGV